MEIRKDLLADLANHLEKKVPKGRFSIRGWTFTPTRHTCKTAGCAIGHAPDVPSIAKTGFTCVIEPRLPPQGAHIGPRSGWYAVSSLFGISYTQAEYLFAESSYKTGYTTTKEEVAKRLRNFIRRPRTTPFRRYE